MEKGDSNDEGRASGVRLPPGTEMIELNLQTLQYRTLLVYLFTHPKLAAALLLARPFMYKSILAIVLLCVAGGLAMAELRSDWGAEEIRAAVEFFHRSVGDTRVTGKGLSWAKTDAALPASWERNGFRLTVTGNLDPAGARRDSAVPAASASDVLPGGSVRMGLVVSPGHAWYWTGVPGGGDQDTSWQELPVLGRLKGMDGSDEFLLDKESIPAYARLFAMAVFLARWIMESSDLLSQWLSWCAMLALASLFSGIAVGSVRNVLRTAAPGAGMVMMPLWRRLQLAVSLSANMMLIPTFAALVYSASGFGPPSSLISVTLIVYLAYVCIEGRQGHFMTPGASSGGRR